MLAFKCLSGDQARASIDWGIYICIAYAFGVSTALEKTNVAAGIAQVFVIISEWRQGLSEGQGVVVKRPHWLPALYGIPEICCCSASSASTCQMQAWRRDKQCTWCSWSSCRSLSITFGLSPLRHQIAWPLNPGSPPPSTSAHPTLQAMPSAAAQQPWPAFTW
jgi:hypothetical protein